MSKNRACYDLLLDLFFEADELRRFTRMSPLPKNIWVDLPSPPISIAGMAHAVVERLEQFGVAQEFFERLILEFPRRGREIKEVADLWIPLSPSERKEHQTSNLQKKPRRDKYYLAALGLVSLGIPLIAVILRDTGGDKSPAAMPPLVSGSIDHVILNSPESLVLPASSAVEDSIVQPSKGPEKNEEKVPMLGPHSASRGVPTKVTIPAWKKVAYHVGGGGSNGGDDPEGRRVCFMDKFMDDKTGNEISACINKNLGGVWSHTEVTYPMAPKYSIEMEILISGGGEVSIINFTDPLRKYLPTTVSACIRRIVASIHCGPAKGEYRLTAYRSESDTSYLRRLELYGTLKKR